MSSGCSGAWTAAQSSAAGRRRVWARRTSAGKAAWTRTRWRWWSSWTRGKSSSLPAPAQAGSSSWTGWGSLARPASATSVPVLPNGAGCLPGACAVGVATLTSNRVPKMVKVASALGEVDLWDARGMEAPESSPEPLSPSSCSFYMSIAEVQGHCHLVAHSTTAALPIFFFFFKL